MMTRFTVLHVEDDGQARRNFIDEVIPPHKFPFDVVHANRVTEVLDNEELKGKIKSILERRTVDFIVIDLALSGEQHTILNEWFSIRRWPPERPNDIEGGIGLADRLIKHLAYPAEKISFLTRHRPNTTCRDLNMVTKTWWGYPVMTHYKDSADELLELRREIFEACGYVPASEVSEKDSQASAHTSYRGFLPFVICASDNETFRKKVEGAVRLYNNEQSEGERAEQQIIDTSVTGAEGFEEAFRSFVQNYERFDCFLVIDFTIGREQNDKVEEACRTGDFDGILRDLPGIRILKRVREEIETHSTRHNTTIIAVNRSGHHPRLVRWCMKKLRVDFVLDESDFTSNFISAIEFFRSLHR